MTIGSISAQSPYSSPVPGPPSAPRSAPPPPLYAGLEEFKNLRVQDVPKFTGDIIELNEGRKQQTIGTNQLNATSKQGTLIDVAVNASTPPALTPAFSKQQTEEVLPPSVAPNYSVSLSREDGNALHIDFTQNVRIHEAKNGTTSIYFSDTNKTRTYGIDGTFVEEEGDTLASNVDAIIINTSGTFVQGGNGDNIIFNFANDAEIVGGTGNDTIILADDISGNSVKTGEGNDTVKGRLITNTNINLGDGNNTLDFSGMAGGSITAGDGNNNITFSSAGKMRNGSPRDEKGMFRDGALHNATIKIGDGNNGIYGLNISNGSIVDVGNGDNSFARGNVGENSSIKIGNGDNNIEVCCIAYNGTFNVGNGNNNISVDRIGLIQRLGSDYQGNGAQLNIGGGNNIINMGRTDDNGDVSIGNGNNVISIGDLHDDSKVTIGDGHNAISGHSIVGNASMNIGNGNNTVQFARVQNNATLSMGNGNNSAKVFFVDDNSALIAGDGNNGIRIDTVKRNGQVRVGDGANDMGIGTLRDEASLEAGDGDNLIKINLMRDTSSATFGTGDNLSILNSRFDDSKFSGSGSLYVFNQYHGQLSEIARQFTERKAQRVEDGLPTTMFVMNHASYMKDFGHGFTPPSPNTPPKPGAPGVDINFSWSDQFGHWGSYPINKYV